MEKVIYFGQKGSYSEKAMFEAQKIYKFSDDEIISSSYIDEIIQEVEKSENVIGILPIENSIVIAGSPKIRTSQRRKTTIKIRTSLPRKTTIRRILLLYPAISIWLRPV